MSTTLDLSQNESIMKVNLSLLFDHKCYPLHRKTKVLFGDCMGVICSEVRVVASNLIELRGIWLR